MNLWRAVTLIALAGLCLAQSATFAEPKPRLLQAGAGTSTSRLPIGLKILGSFAPQPSEHFHDELHARCLVLDDGEKRLALVVCDFIGFQALVSQEARKLFKS